MESMTPEERFTKIENLILTITGIRANQEISISRHDREIAEALKETKEIRETLKQTAATIARLAELQERTEERLLTLIEHVDGHEARIKRLEGRS